MLSDEREPALHLIEPTRVGGRRVPGWALVKKGRKDEGITQIRQGLAATHATGGELYYSGLFAVLADACLEAGKPEEGLAALAEAFDRTAHACSELYRLKGELLLMQDESSAAEAESCIQRAIEIARAKSAKSWELRAITSLARLLAHQGRRDQARSMLAEIYGWFTEGFDTADLKEAKALLEALDGNRPE